jgi:Ca2+/H+ antiporter
LQRFVLTSAVPIILFGLLVFVLLAFAGVVLLSLALRYRAGTARRQARPWVASLNVWLTGFSSVFFLSFTLLLSFWVPSAFRFAVIGMGCGAILGLLGLALTRWERRPNGLFYTPNRWLAVVITLAIAARFIYGWWRATHSGGSAPGEQHWLITASATQLSVAVAAGLVAYYLIYSIGVRLQLARHDRRLESTATVLTIRDEQRRGTKAAGSPLLKSSFLILAWRLFRYVLRHWRR